MADDSPLHILSVTPYYSPAWAYGGPVRVACEVAVRLVRRGHIVEVLTTDALDSGRRAEAGLHDVDGVAVRRVRNISNYLAWRRFFLPPGYQRKLRQMITQFDVVHLHEFRSVLNAAAVPVLRASGKPFILSPHGSLPVELGRTTYKRVYDRLYGNWLLNHAAMCHAITEMESRQFTEQGVEKERIKIFPNGIDVDVIKERVAVDAFKKKHGIPEGIPVIGYLGRLNKIKGIDFLIDAFAELIPACHAILLIAGPDDGVEQDLKAQCQRLGIERHVRFTGYVQGEAEKAAVYRASNVIVLPSRYEILGITLLESLLNATPVITTDRCGLSKRLMDSGIGDVVPFGNVQALVQALTQAVTNREESHERALRGQAFVRAHYNWDSVTDLWEAAYRRLAVPALKQDGF